MARKLVWLSKIILKIQSIHSAVLLMVLLIQIKWWITTMPSQQITGFPVFSLSAIQALLPHSLTDSAQNEYATMMSTRLSNTGQSTDMTQEHIVMKWASNTIFPSAQSNNTHCGFSLEVYWVKIYDDMRSCLIQMAEILLVYEYERARNRPPHCYFLMGMSVCYFLLVRGADSNIRELLYWEKTAPKHNMKAIILIMAVIFVLFAEFSWYRNWSPLCYMLKCLDKKMEWVGIGSWVWFYMYENCMKL